MEELISKFRLFKFLFWFFVAILVGAIFQNIFKSQPILDNKVFIAMGVLLSLVVSYEILKRASIKDKIQKSVEEEAEYEGKLAVQVLREQLSGLEDRLKDLEQRMQIRSETDKQDGRS